MGDAEPARSDVPRCELVDGGGWDVRHLIQVDVAVILCCVGTAECVGRCYKGLVCDLYHVQRGLKKFTQYNPRLPIAQQTCTQTFHYEDDDAHDAGCGDTTAIRMMMKKMVMIIRMVLKTKTTTMRVNNIDDDDNGDGDGGDDDGDNDEF